MSEAELQLWLSIPETLLLRATGDLPGVIKAKAAKDEAALGWLLTRALGPIHEEPGSASAASEDDSAAYRRGREALAGAPVPSPYEKAVAELWAALAIGQCPAQGRRSPRSALEPVSIAEFMTLQPQGSNAVNQNGEAVWYGLVVDVVALARTVTGSPEPKLPTRDEAIKARLDSGERPGKTLPCKAFCNGVRADCKVGGEMRGFGERHIRKLTTKELERRLGH